MNYNLLGMGSKIKKDRLACATSKHLFILFIYLYIFIIIRLPKI